MRVFIDTSVIIASLLSSTGGSAKIFTYIKTGKITGITSQTAISELLNEKKYKKFKRSRDELEQYIAGSGLLVRKHISIEEITLYQGMIDTEDAHLIAGSHLTRCNYLLTLDKKHLLRSDIQERFLPLRILSPKELLEEMVHRPDRRRVK